MIIKVLWVSSPIYSASNINVPKDIGSKIKGRLLRFLGIRMVEGLSNGNGQVLPFFVLQSRYSFQKKKTTFLHYFQVVSAIYHSLRKTKSKRSSNEMVNTEDPGSFRPNENVNINFLKAKSTDVYWLIIDRRCRDKQTGPRRWNKDISQDKTHWKKIFKSVRKTCKENRFREFHFKFIYRVCGD